MRRFRRALALSVIVICTCEAPRALATFHEWRIDQVYSNASGTVQFIELNDTQDGELFLSGHPLTSSIHSFTFPSNLATGTPTAGHHLLLATPGYFALKGVPTADFNLGVDHFFSPTGDTLTYALGLSLVTFSGGALPLDSVHSLVFDRLGNQQPTEVNLPTNLAGQSGSFPSWENQNNRFDVNNDNAVAPIDVLQVINELLVHGQHALAAPVTGHTPPPFVDVNGDGSVTNLDVLQVINNLLAASPTVHSSAVSAFVAPTISVPEPGSGTLALMGLILLGAAAWMRGKKRSGR